eukprot:356963-Chlamydomonas_euryale.AAC.2
MVGALGCGVAPQQQPLPSVTTRGGAGMSAAYAGVDAYAAAAWKPEAGAGMAAEWGPEAGAYTPTLRVPSRDMPLRAGP